MLHPHPSTHPGARRVVRTLATLLGAVALLSGLIGGATTASAATYQYWGYWQLSSGSWAFAPKGPAETVPADGSVEGWRWAVADESSSRTPRVSPTFEQLCAAVPAEAGKKRVGLVVDFGREADGDGAPVPTLLTRCVVLASTATGSDALAAAGAVRVDKGLVCGIAGYPATGCGGPIAAPNAAQQAPDTPLTLPTVAPSPGRPDGVTPSAAASAAASAAPTSGAAESGTSWPLYLVLALVVLAFAAIVARRRRTGA